MGDTDEPQRFLKRKKEHHDSKDETSQDCTVTGQRTAGTDQSIGSAKVQLLDVSNEILLCISNHLEFARELNAFARSSRRLYYLLNSNLYRQSASFPLFWAARTGRPETARRSLEMGACIDARDDYGRTALLHASEHGQETMVEYLLEQCGSDIRERDVFHETALHIAADMGHEGVVRVLLARKDIELNARAMEGVYPHPSSREDIEPSGPYPQPSGYRTPLLQATIQVHAGVVELLLAQDGIDADAKSATGASPFLVAADGHYLGVLKLLLEKGDVDVNQTVTAAEDMWTARDHMELTETMRSQLVQKTICVGAGNPALCLAAGRGDMDMLMLLLAQEGIDVNLGNSEGRTPLSVAADEPDPEIVKALLNDPRIVPDTEDHQGMTPLFYAIEAEDGKHMKLLLQTGAVNAGHRNRFGSAPIHHPSAFRCERIAKLLLAEESCDPNCPDGRDQTPLQLACWSATLTGDLTVVKLLLRDSRVNVNRSSGSGRTTLSVAAEGGGPSDLVKLLLAHPDIDPDLNNPEITKAVESCKLWT